MHYICKILSADIGYVQHFCDKFIQALLSKIDQWTQSGCVIYIFIKSSWEYLLTILRLLHVLPLVNYIQSLL